MYVAVAAAVIGAGASIYSASQSADATASAADQQGASSAAALGLQRDQFNYAKQMQEPFYKGSMPAYYDLVSAVTGRPQTFVDPNAPGGQALSEKEIRDANIAAIQKSFPNWDTRQIEIGLQHPENLPYQTGKSYYRDATGAITDKAPASATVSTGVWKPQDSPAYQWQQEQANKNNSRTLRALGRENSSYGMGEQFKTQQNLAASEYDKQLGRLADLTNIARGGASSLAAAGTGYANSGGNILQTNGANQANATLAGSAIQQNGLYNGIQSGMSLANLGLKAYNGGNWTNGGMQASDYYKPNGEAI